MAYKNKEDQRAYARRHYEANKAIYVKRAAVHKTAQKDKARRFVYSYLDEHPCVDCGETDPICLEFDHLRDKTHNVSNMILQGLSLPRIQIEIDKCDVVCANCHRRRTSKQFNWRILRD